MNELAGAVLAVPQRRWAVETVTIATGRLLSDSFGRKSCPRTIGIPSTRKYSGETMLYEMRESSGASPFATSAAVGKRASIGVLRFDATRSTSGCARSAATTSAR